MNISKVSVILLKIAIILAIVFFIGKTVVTDWQAVRSYEWRIQPIFLLFSCIGFLAAFSFLVWIWRSVLTAFGYPISYREAWSIYFIGNLGRYIPGKIWTVAGVAYMAGKSGVPAVIAGTAAVCAQAYSILSSFVFFVLFFILRNQVFSGVTFLWTLPVPFVLIVVFLIPDNLERALNFVLIRFGKEQITLNISTAAALKITMFYLASWILFGVSFWFVVSSVAGQGLFNPLYLSGAFAVSYIIGYLAFFAPGGIGVREGMLSLLLAGTISTGVAAVLAVVLRLIITVVELGCVATVFFQKGVLYGKKEKETRT